MFKKNTRLALFSKSLHKLRLQCQILGRLTEARGDRLLQVLKPYNTTSQTQIFTTRSMNN